MRRIVVAEGLLSDVGRVSKKGTLDIHGCSVRATASAVDLRLSGIDEALARTLGAELYSTARLVIELGAADGDLYRERDPVVVERARLLAAIDQIDSELPTGIGRSTLLQEIRELLTGEG